MPPHVISTAFMPRTLARIFVQRTKRAIAPKPENVGTFQRLEERMLLSATLEDAGISQRVIDYIDNLPWTTQILTDATLTNTLDALVGTQTAPANATVISSVGGLSQINAGTLANPNVYLIQGDLTITNTIQVPSNVHIYVDGSIFKQGNFSTNGSVFATENTGANADAIFRLNGSDNVKLIGVNNALLHSNPTLDASQPHTTAVFIHSNSSNIEVDGFEMAYVWNGVAAHPFNIRDVTVTNNYIRDTLNRAVWSLGTTNFRAAHNFVENAAMDSFDWDAFTDDAIGYENVSIGAGRWAGFVEEGTEDSYFIRGLGILADFGNPNRGFMLGWADNGSSAFFVGNNPNPEDWTEHNYFIDNVIFDPGNIPNSGGDYFAKNNNGKGPTYFWANRGFGAGQSANNFDNAEWLTFLPTSGGRNKAVNAVQLLADLDAEFNAVDAILLGPASFNVVGNASLGTVVGSIEPLNADPSDLTFQITAGNIGDAFRIDSNGQITVDGPLDFNTTSDYRLTIEATDNSGPLTTGQGFVDIAVQSPFTTTATIFDYSFVSPDFTNSSDVRNQQGWTGQAGWSITDANGRGFLASDTTLFQGVTNNAIIDAEAGQTIRLTLDFDLDLGNTTDSDQFRFGVTTLNNGGAGNFIPALGNNNGAFLSGKLAFRDDDGGFLDFYAEESQGSPFSASANDLGLNPTAGDWLTDTIRLTWNATKSETSGVWEVELTASNLDTGVTLGDSSSSVTNTDVYADGNDLYAGIRGLQNSTNTTFRVDRYAASVITPGAGLIGDYDGSGLVEQGDLNLVLSNWGRNVDTLGIPDNWTNDLPSGLIDQAELNRVLSNWGQALPQPIEVQTQSVTRDVATPSSAASVSTQQEATLTITSPEPTYQRTQQRSSALNQVVENQTMAQMSMRNAALASNLPEQSKNSQTSSSTAALPLHESVTPNARSANVSLSYAKSRLKRGQQHALQKTIRQGERAQARLASLVSKPDNQRSSAQRQAQRDPRPTRASLTADAFNDAPFAAERIQPLLVFDVSTPPEPA